MFPLLPLQHGHKPTKTPCPTCQNPYINHFFAKKHKKIILPFSITATMTERPSCKIYILFISNSRSFMIHSIHSHDPAIGYILTWPLAQPNGAPVLGRAEPKS